MNISRNEDDVISKHENDEEVDEEGVTLEKKELEVKPVEPKEADPDRPSSSGE